MADELRTEPPAQPPDVLYPDLSEPEYYGVGHFYGEGYDTAHCLTLLENPCACYKSVLGGGLNGFSHGCKNKPVVEPMMSEVAL